MLPEIRVASPCPASWERMAGDTRVRHCSDCNLNVYNFSAMTEREILRLIAESKGQRLCGRLYRRSDGTLITRDCPVGLRTRVRRVSRKMGALLSAAMSVGVAFAQAPQKERSSLVQLQSASAIDLVVTDQSGAVIPNAMVSIAPAGTGAKVEGKTNQEGKFRASVASGQYFVTAKQNGFTALRQTVIVVPGEMRNVTMILQVSRTENIGVIAVPSLETQSSRPTSEFLSMPTERDSAASNLTQQNPHQPGNSFKRFFSRLGNKLGF